MKYGILKPYELIKNILTCTYVHVSMYMYIHTLVGILVRNHSQLLIDLHVALPRYQISLTSFAKLQNDKCLIEIILWEVSLFKN